MRYMGGWTYEDYLAQPAEMIDLIIVRMNREYEIYGAPILYTVALTTAKE